MDKELFAAVDAYIAQLFAPPDAALSAVLQSMREANMPGINVSPNQGKLLYMLALLCRARRILEIGTLGGYSAIWMAQALPDDGHLVTIEYDAMHAAVARENILRAGLEEKVEIRVGQALDILSRLVAEHVEPFDMIFIDADKPPYEDYFQWSLRLARPGTLIVADNVIRSGKVLDTTSPDQNTLGVQRLHTALAASPAVTATIVQTVGVKGYDGMALAVVKG